MTLQYPARCEKCSRVMYAGSEASFYLDEFGKRRFIHDGDCPEDEPVVTRGKPAFTDVIETRECSRWACSGATGIAFDRGSPVPSRCPHCGSEWLTEEGEADVGDTAPPEDVEFAIPEFDRP